MVWLLLLLLRADPCPPATKEVVEEYNDLRANILLLYDVRAATLNCDYDLQSARARLEAFAPDRVSTRTLFFVCQ